MSTSRTAAFRYCYCRLIPPTVRIKRLALIRRSTALTAALQVLRVLEEKVRTNWRPALNASPLLC